MPGLLPRRRTAFLIAAQLAASFAAPSSAQEAPTASPAVPVIQKPPPRTTKGTSGRAVLTGSVVWSGPAPEMESVPMKADRFCAALHPEGIAHRPPFAVHKGRLGGVVIHVKGLGPRPPGSAEPVLLDQRGCEFRPAVVALHVAQPLLMRNSDPTLHNVHAMPRLNDEFNIGQPMQGNEARHSFSRPELFVPIVDDLHPWMKAHVAVFDHPYFAVSDASGAFTIAGLSAGRYEVEAAHPTLGRATKRIAVDADGGTVEFIFPATATSK